MYLALLVLLVLSLLFVVIVDRVFILFCDGHRHSQADSSLQCRMIDCARVERCIFVVGLVILGFVRFILEVHAFHGFDSFVFCCISVFFHCLSQRRVGGSYALLVSPAVTRLTVYRRLQVFIKCELASTNAICHVYGQFV